MEAQFEALTLAYMSPETRDSLRHSLRDSVRDSSRLSLSRLSCESSSSRGSDSQGDFLRFGATTRAGAVEPGAPSKPPGV